MKEFFNKLKTNDKLNTSYPIKKEDWASYKTNKSLNFDNKDMSFYIHIPFCMSKCKFCEYIKYTNPTNEMQEKYINTLICDIENFVKKNKGIKLFGIDVGGGTPTCLNDNNFEKLLKYLKKYTFFNNTCDFFEPSIESTFNSITENKIKIIAECGFKRISFGIQTVNKKYLKNNDRSCPTLNKINQTFEWCKKYNIKKINIDLMYGLKGQTKQDLKKSINLIKYLKPSAVTLYEMRTNILNVKEFKTKRQLFNQYKYLFKQIKKMGYFGKFGQNTFSLFKEDLGLSSYLKSRMIQNINYKGFGISAQSKSESGISYNVGKTPKSLEDCLKGSFKEEDTYLLPKEEMLAKYIAVSGYYGEFNLNIMSDILKTDAKDTFKNQLKFLCNKKLININNNIINITKKGFKHYGAVLAMFYPKQHTN